MKRFAEYHGWTIEASPTRLVKQRLFVSGVVIERDGVRFVFADLGNRVYRRLAYEAGSSGPNSGSTTTMATAVRGKWHGRTVALKRATR
ncbi:conserved hypothetical protein [Ricinus communis]|uniref:Uncharacterized protein n=1 Tax=Ricinus communis TaxID=3988 RepID=B9TIL8_RICCO|nr:conserved hypothetical protein [Ricinus communis]